MPASLSGLLLTVCHRYLRIAPLVAIRSAALLSGRENEGGLTSVGRINHRQLSPTNLKPAVRGGLTSGHDETNYMHRQAVTMPWAWDGAGW